MVLAESLGDRVRHLRVRRAYTQERLAEAAGVSVDLVKKLEQGQRQSARLASLTALANALDVALSELTDKRPRLDGAPDHLVIGIRNALFAVDALPGAFAAPPSADEPSKSPSLAAVTAEVRTAWGHYWAGRYFELALAVPGLLNLTRTARHEVISPVSTASLAQAYFLTSYLLVQLGREDLAAISAERALAVAVEGDDELLVATLRGAYCWILAAQGRPGEAVALAMAAADDIEPQSATAPVEQVVTWGGLLITALAPASTAGDRVVVEELMRAAHVAAQRVDADVRHHQVTFGRGHLALQITHAHVVLGNAPAALAAAAEVTRSDLSPVTHGRHLIDVAQAHAEMGDDRTATNLLTASEALAPVWFRHQPVARDLVSAIAYRQPRVSGDVRDLLTALHVH